MIPRRDSYNRLHQRLTLLERDETQSTETRVAALKLRSALSALRAAQMANTPGFKKRFASVARIQASRLKGLIR